MENIFLEVKKHKHILLCGDNINSLSVARSLGQEGIKTIAIVLDYSKFSLLKASKFIDKIHLVYSEEESLDVLMQYADLNCKPFVYTTDDNHERLLDLHYDELKDAFYFFYAGESGRVTSFMNKEKLCCLAKECGFRIPKGVALNRGELPKNLTYPVFTKTINPYAKGWKKDVVICYNENELKKAYISFVSERLLVQEYIPKKNELEVHGFSIKGGEQIYFSFASLYYRLTDKNFGAYKYYNIFNDEKTRHKIELMIRKVGFSGNFEVEFIVTNDDQLVFLEINFRFPMSNYACTFGGANMPMLWAASTLSGKIVKSSNLKSEQFSALNEFSDFAESVLGRKISVWQFLKDLKRADMLFTYNRKDPKPFFVELKYKILKKFFRHHKVGT